jgi:DNA-binding NtrC family response regulator
MTSVSTFEKFAAMACANPFGAERLTLEREVGGAARGDSRDDIFARSFARVEQAVLPFKRRRALRVAAKDAAAADLAIVYVVFHKFSTAIDASINAQERSAALVKPTFVSKVLTELAEYGLNDASNADRIALIFQLRRAYVFIDRAITGTSAVTQKLREALWNSIFTHDLRLYSFTLKRRMEDFSTILLGATGTGKGAAAAAIGMSGCIPYNESTGMFAANFAETFVSLNLSEFSPTLIESELFGHQKGAFTGAIQNRVGAFERCSAFGSVFLDEIGELDPAVQVKLLRVLEARQFTPVGGATSRRFSGRTIAATHRSLETLREQGRMRHDFYYRLCSEVIRLPTLRERLDADPQELIELAERLVLRIVGEPAPAVLAEVLGAIERDLPERYPWPGNVRELEQCIRSVLLTRSYHGDPLALTSHSTSTGPKQAQIARAKSLYREMQNYGAVARALGIDRRTVTKYVSGAAQ